MLCYEHFWLIMILTDGIRICSLLAARCLRIECVLSLLLTASQSDNLRNLDLLSVRKSETPS